LIKLKIKENGRQLQKIKRPSMRKIGRVVFNGYASASMLFSSFPG
jgi:hypothetical protein